MYDRDYSRMVNQLAKMPLSTQARKTIRGQMLPMTPEQRSEYFDRILDNCCRGNIAEVPEI
jgi:hypothetical protein